MAKDLTDKQIKFCQQYILDFNATQAYKLVYGIEADETAAVCASKMLRNAKVRKYLLNLKESVASALQITREKVLNGYARLAFYDARKFYDAEGNLIKIPDLDEETSFALSSFEVVEEWAEDEKTKKRFVVGHTKKVKMSDRKVALDSIARMLGYNEPDKVRHEGEVQIIKIPDNGRNNNSPATRLPEPGAE